MGIPAASRIRSRPALLTFFSLVSVLLFLSSYHPSTPHVIGTLSAPVKLLYSSQQHEKVPSIEPLEVLSQLYEDERVALLSQYDQRSTEALIRTAPGALNADFNAYITRLESFVDRYFLHSVHHEALIGMLSRMVNARPPVEGGEFEKHVYSFDKGGPEGVPGEFDWWNRRLGHRGWKIDVGDDDKMEQWFEESAAMQPEELRLDDDEALDSGKANWEELWHGLGRPVLKSDLLRYLMILIKGGMYTDSDTSILSDPNLWGTHAHDFTPRGLVALQRAMRHIDPDHPSSKQQIPSIDTDADDFAAWQGANDYQPEHEGGQHLSIGDEHEKERPQEPEQPEHAEQDEAQEQAEEDAQAAAHSESDAAPSAFSELEAEVEANAEAPADFDSDSESDTFQVDVLQAELEDARIDEERLAKRQSPRRRGMEMTEELDFASNPIKPASRGINNAQVAMVVAVEYDVHHPRQDPRFGYTRDLQIVQWTFMAKPNHPIFLDVLETATTEIMKRRAEGNAHDNWQSILDVTGPGPFTDAVLRYLLVQYGVQPQELIGMEDGALIGDVLVLPLHAFGSYLGGENDWNAHDPSTRCTAHGFRGRWKGGMGFERRNLNAQR